MIDSSVNRTLTIESKSPAGAPNTAMDLHNNKYGRDFGKKYITATSEELLEMLIDQVFIYVPQDKSIPQNTEGLVYILAKRPFDVMMVGTLTNPDSGGPWDATFHFNQCGDIIRGQYIIERDNTIMKRRFEGTLYNGFIMLNISPSYVIENPGNFFECLGMQMTLSGDEVELSGNWTSNNCQKGGLVLIKQ